MFVLNILNFALIIILIVIFLRGYFPVNQYEGDVIPPPGKIGAVDVDPSVEYRPAYDRLVLMVIDSMREDFVTEENMPYTFNHKSCLVPLKVEAPTVTLPRIKAMTMGNVPQFADIVLNLGSTTKVEDSFLHRAFAAGKKMVFYGDDTWLRIYPDLFWRKMGFHSLFITDFYEIDNKTTQHFEPELKMNDWDMLFLHYLGLDHIGHVEGPYSDLVRPKLHEMDGIIENIDRASKTWNQRTLLLVTGDHGMKNSGGHGGTTFEETHVPLIAFGSTCGEQKLVHQTDISTTLSALLGVEMNSGGVGSIIPDFFGDYGPSRLLYVLYYNYVILMNRAKESLTECRQIVNMHGEFLHKFNGETNNYKDSEQFRNLVKSYDVCLKEISKTLVQSSVEQDEDSIRFALWATVTSFMYIIYNHTLFLKKHRLQIIPVVCLVLNTFLFLGFNSLQFITYPFYIIDFVLKANIIYSIVKTMPWNRAETSGYGYVIFLILHAFTLLSTSLLEEEHVIYLFYAGTAIVAMLHQHVKDNTGGKTVLLTLVVLSLLRFLRTINSTGWQYASDPDLSDWLSHKDNLLYLAVFHAGSLILTYVSVLLLTKTKDVLRKLCYVSVLTLIFVYKIFYSYNTLAKIIWVLIALTSLWDFKRETLLFVKITTAWVLTITLLLRPYNTILIPACFLISHFARKHVARIDILSVLHCWLGFTLFFCQGHSNSLATVDVSSGYIGLNSYIPPLVFFLTLCHTYAFPVLALLLLLTARPFKVNEVFTVAAINRLWVLIAMYVLVIMHRKHAFIWTVFSPKLLIEAAHTLALFVFVCFVKSCCSLEDALSRKFGKGLVPSDGDGSSETFRKEQLIENHLLIS